VKQIQEVEKSKARNQETDRRTNKGRQEMEGKDRKAKQETRKWRTEGTGRKESK
jgi:hypothetical protein